MNAQASSAALIRILQSWQRWYRLRRAVNWAIRGFILSLGGALIFSLAALLQEFLLREEVIFIVAAMALLGALVTALVAYAWPFPRMRAARYFDRAFRLHERTSTALELASQPYSSWPNPELIEKQMEDALMAARRVQPQRELPVRGKWYELLMGGILLAGVILVISRGDASFRIAFQKRVVQAVIRQQALQIEALRNQIAEDESLTIEQRQALMHPLEEALQSLRHSQSLEGAVSALYSTEQQLRALSGEQAAQQAQVLQEIGESLMQQPGSKLQSFGHSLAKGSVLEAAQKMQSIDPESLNQVEAQRLASQLEEVASALGEINPTLAENMRQAARALHQGDAEAARQALQRTSQVLNQTGQQIHQAQIAEQAAAGVSESHRRVVQAGRAALGRQTDSQANTGQGGNQGQGDNQSSGQGAGTNSQSGAGGGSGRGESNGGNETRSEAHNAPIGQDNLPGDGGERPYEPIYAPQRLGANKGDEVSLPGSNQPGDQILGQGNPAPGETDGSSVPYIEVLPFYEEAYRQAIESGRVPLFLRELVRRYFSSLQP